MFKVLISQILRIAQNHNQAQQVVLSVVGRSDYVDDIAPVGMEDTESMKEKASIGISIPKLLLTTN